MRTPHGWFAGVALAFASGIAVAQEPPPDGSTKPTNDELYGRFSPTLLGGVVLSQEHGGFSQSDLYLRFIGDTAWGYPTDWTNGCWFDTNWFNLHSQIDVALTSIPTEDAGADQQPDTFDDFIKSEKAYVGAVGLDYRPFGVSVVGGHRLSFGLRGTAGIQSISNHKNSANNADQVNYFVGGGLRVADTIEPSDPKKALFNPPVHHSIDILYSRYENIDEPRLTVDAQLRFQSENHCTYFVGTRAILGKGEDDLQVTLGIDVPLEKLGSWIEGLVPSFLDPRRA